MNIEEDRRMFLKTGATLAAAGMLGRQASAQDASEKASKAGKESPGEKIVLGIMGVNGRGSAIARGMMAAPNTEIGYICDVDSRVAVKVGDLVSEVQKKKPKVVGDFRSILDDSNIDVLVVAAPNHWHAPATILGCAAGKHVYVEKPCSHTTGRRGIGGRGGS